MELAQTLVITFLVSIACGAAVAAFAIWIGSKIDRLDKW